jgi:hypothetical protein
MIKTATQTTQQEINPETADYKETPGVSKENLREQTGNFKEQSTIAREPAGNSKEQMAIAREKDLKAADIPSYQEVQKELEEKRKQLITWQNKLDELMYDPNNADKVVNYLNGLQFLKNKIAELQSQLQMMSVSTNGYSFQDNQSVLHAGSVRRKDKDALSDIKRDDKINVKKA